MTTPSDPHEHRLFSEPEILPPGQSGRRSRGGATWTRLVIDADGIPRVSVTRIGPLGMFVLWLVGALVALALVIFFFGAFLFLIPLIVVIFAVGVGISIWRFVTNQQL